MLSWSLRMQLLTVPQQHSPVAEPWRFNLAGYPRRTSGSTEVFFSRYQSSLRLSSAQLSSRSRVPCISSARSSFIIVEKKLSKKLLPICHLFVQQSAKEWTTLKRWGFLKSVKSACKERGDGEDRHGPAMAACMHAGADADSNSVRCHSCSVHMIATVAMFWPLCSCHPISVIPKIEQRIKIPNHMIPTITSLSDQIRDLLQKNKIYRGLGGV